MKKLILTLVFVASFAMQALAYDFQSGNLLYTILSTDPPCVSLAGHVDGTEAQGELVIPETVTYEGVTYTVTSIGQYAFWGCKNLTGQLVIPNTVTRICPAAFGQCSGFTGMLVIPESVTELSLPIPPVNGIEGAFEECSGFTGLVLPSSLEVIGGGVGGGCFAWCSGLTGELMIPNTVKEIYSMAFYGCTGLSGELKLPDSLEYIGYEAFGGCSGFTGKLVFPEAVDWIGDYAFARCSGFTDVELHHQVFYQYNFGDYVFSGWNWSEIDLPEGWTATGQGTFADNANLTKVHLPESLTNVGSDCFKNCSKLSEINIPESVYSFGSQAFSHCSNLTEIHFPKHLKSIGAGAFNHCSGLMGEIIIPDSVEWISLGTFDSCVGINRFVAGSSVNRIAEWAFRDTQLESFCLKATTPPQLFRQTQPNAWHFPADIPITVPCGTLEAYQNAEGWSDFTNISEGVVYVFFVLSSNEDSGIVNLLKEATCDDMTVKVEAVPGQGGTFLYWEANGERVSSENPYNFTLDKDTRLVAIFSGTGIGETGQAVSLYPNPTKEKLTIDGAEAAEIQIYNAIGQCVKTSRNTNEISVEGLSQGVYLLRITTADGMVISERVVKE